MGEKASFGIPLSLGLSSSAIRIIIQVSGSAYRINSKDFVAALKECPSLAIGIQRYAPRTCFSVCPSGGLQPAA